MYHLWGNVYERIMPGAFDKAVKENDVRACFNHDGNLILGRTKSGTLLLTLDSLGLRYEIDAPDTQLVRDQVLSPIERGDVSGSSFMFIPRKVNWVEETRDDGIVLEFREIEDVELWEVGPVTFPAYESTTTGARSINNIERIKEERANAKVEKRGKPSSLAGTSAVATDDEIESIAIEADYRVAQHRS